MKNKKSRVYFLSLLSAIFVLFAVSDAQKIFITRGQMYEPGLQNNSLTEYSRVDWMDKLTTSQIALMIFFISLFSLFLYSFLSKRNQRA